MRRDSGMLGLSGKSWLVVGWYLAVALGLLITIAPLWWTIVGSFKPNDIILMEVNPFSIDALLPGTTLEGYVAIFEKGFGRAIANTLFVSIASVVAGLLINSLAGFAFAWFHFRGKNLLFAFVLVTFAVPAEAISLPLFSLIRALGWFDTYTALIVPNVANGLIIFLFRQFFLGVPKEMIEAARVDGLSWWRVYWTICMPLAKPVSIGAGLLMFVHQWESFLWPLIAAPSPEKHLIQVSLSRFATEYSAIWNEQLAASTIAALLPLVFIFYFQKQFVSAIAGVDLK